MLRFAARRLIGMIAVLFAISVIVFLIFNVIPNSDPAARIAGKTPNPALLARVTADLALDRPLPVQSGPIAPAFGMPGGGTQFFTGGSTVQDLIRGGYLRELP